MAGTSAGPALIHEAAFFTGESDLIWQTVPFLMEARSLGEPALVMLRPERAAIVRAALGSAAAGVCFLDKGGRSNPGTLIQTWRAFLVEQNRPWVRGIDEPLRPGAPGAEIAESQLHERLLNEAFSGTGHGLLLRCLYDTETCSKTELADARATHSVIAGDLAHGMIGVEAVPNLFAGGLAAPPPRAHREAFAGTRSVAWARRQVLVRARLSGLNPEHS
jgi:hypothetical protein